MTQYLYSGWRWLAAPVLLFGGLLGPAQAQDALCAQVKIQIDQTAVVTRTAFEATLSINNETDGALEDLFVAIEIKDLDGNVVNELFAGEDLPVLLDGVGAVDGTSDIAPQTEATAKWLIIPGEFATFDANPVKYTVGGSVSHLQEGVLITIPLFPVEIDVYPDAALFLDYYLQQNVYSDNPFTDPVEPAEPFSLGVRVLNEGFGDAKDLKITSSQPKIIENNLGLYIGFQILGAQVGLMAVQPCLTVEMGTIPAGGSQVARWLLSSTLQGQFVEMSASFEHVNGLDDPSISLIKAVNIFPMVHVANFDIPTVDGVDDPFEDGLPDFLVPVDGAFVPQDDFTGKPMFDFFHEAHLSDGTIEPVSFVPATTLGEAPNALNQTVSLQVTVDQPGWNYIRVDDLGGPGYQLAQITKGRGINRSNLPVGGPGDITNIWSTSRWVSLCTDGTGCDGPFGPDPVLQELVHIVDWFALAGPSEYTLVYEPVSPDSLSADVSTISLATGGVQKLSLNAGPEYALRNYLVLGSITGTGPVPIPGSSLLLPLTPDAYFDLTLLAADVQQLFNTLGTLDDNGQAEAQIFLPPGANSALAGLVVHHAFILFGGGVIDFVSNDVQLVLVP